MRRLLGAPWLFWALLVALSGGVHASYAGAYPLVRVVGAMVVGFSFAGAFYLGRREGRRS